MHTVFSFTALDMELRGSSLEDFVHPSVSLAVDSSATAGSESHGTHEASTQVPPQPTGAPYLSRLLSSRVLSPLLLPLMFSCSLSGLLISCQTYARDLS